MRWRVAPFWALIPFGFGTTFPKIVAIERQHLELDRHNLETCSAKQNQSVKPWRGYIKGIFVLLYVFCLHSTQRATSVTGNKQSCIRIGFKARDELSRLVKIVRVRSRVLKARGTFPLASPDSYPGFKSTNALFHL